MLLTRLDGVDLVFHVAIGLQQVQASVQVGIEEEQAETEHRAAGGADAGDDGLVGEDAAACRIHVIGRHFVGEVANRHGQLAAVRVACHVNSHGAGGVTRVVVGEPVVDPLLAEGAAHVSEVEVPNRVVGDQDVRPSITV